MNNLNCLIKVIIKKKLSDIPYIKKLKSIVNNIILSLGIVSFIIIIFFTSYYFSSGMNQRFDPLALTKKIDKVIINKYLGFSFFEIDNYLKIKFNSFKYLFINNKLETIQVNINQQNLYNLELQRSEKIKGSTKKYERFSEADLVYNDKTYKIKLRVKGDRVLHWYNKDQTSYKIDIRGEERFQGMEEFSVQKPITRNYTYEFIFHKFLKFNNLISLKYSFVNFYMNDSDQGIYAVEEGFAKELIERNKRRNGPIFGLEEKKGTTYPFVEYDLYSKNFWINNHPELISKAYSKINNLKNDDVNVNDIFDLNKWAKFFAIIDLTNTLHGAISKSVKLFYNPVNGKFEPIGFDGHYGLNNINNFIILDFLDSDNTNCSYICEEREWFLKFLKFENGKLNNEFIDLYLDALKRISTDDYLQKFKLEYQDDIDFYNDQLYSDISKTDRGYYKGIAPFIFNKNYLSERSNYIRERISEIFEKKNLKTSIKNNIIHFDQVNKFFLKKISLKCEKNKEQNFYIYKSIELKFKKDCKYLIGSDELSMINDITMDKSKVDMYSDLKDITSFNQVKFINGKYILDENLDLNLNTYLPKNKSLTISSGTKISFSKDVSLTSEGSINFNGTKENPIKIFSDNKLGSIILLNNTYKIDNTLIDNLSYPKNNNLILYGGINIINSDIEIKDSKIQNSNSEDAINIISSKTVINNLELTNIAADAIDIDFGKLTFLKIFCENIKNDCLDISGGIVEGDKLYSKAVYDKGLSFGENSKGLITNSKFFNNKVAVAVKDGSKLKLTQSDFKDNNFDITVFKKKEAYGNAELTLEELNKTKKLNVILGENNFFSSLTEHEIKNLKNNTINEMFY